MLDIKEIIKWFENWTRIKVILHTQEKIVYFKEREIWWGSLGANIGFEENGKNHKFERPVLVYRKFSKDMFWAIPLTSKDREGTYYFSIDDFESTAILCQMRLISPKRLVRRIGIINPDVYSQLKEKLSRLL